MRHSCFIRGRVMPLVIATAAVLGMGSVQAQSTAGSIFGHGPAGATVTATSSTGAQRRATISAKGRYTLSPLPMGTYTVTVEKDGAVADTRKNIPITVGRGAQLDFACPDDRCEAAD